LHVVDASSPQLAEQMAEVERVLDDIGAAAVPQILVCNKCDLLDSSRQPREVVDVIEVHPGVRRPRVFVSAVSGGGIASLRAEISAIVLARLNADAGASDDGSGDLEPDPRPIFHA